MKWRGADARFALIRDPAPKGASRVTFCDAANCQATERLGLRRANCPTACGRIAEIRRTASEIRADSRAAFYVEEILFPAHSGWIMADKKIYVERRNEGDYAVRRAGSERASAIEPTQHKAIERARELNPGIAPHVERVRHTQGGNPDKWRRP